MVISSLGIHHGKVKMLLGIDPGRDKIGWALTDDNGVLLISGIVKKQDLPLFLESLLKREWALLTPWIRENRKNYFNPDTDLRVVVGNGTTCQEILSFLEGQGIYAEIVEERGSTLEARKVFWSLHPPKGLWKLFPDSLRTPNRDIDDLAALVIVRRYITLEARE